MCIFHHKLAYFLSFAILYALFSVGYYLLLSPNSVFTRFVTLDKSIWSLWTFFLNGDNIHFLSCLSTLKEICERPNIHKWQAESVLLYILHINSSCTFPPLLFLVQQLFRLYYSLTCFLYLFSHALPPNMMVKWIFLNSSSSCVSLLYTKKNTI